MNDDPEIPKPLPQISRGSLWSALAMPPVATVIANCLIVLCWNRRSDPYGMIFLLVPLLLLPTILCLSFQFSVALKEHYQDRSARLHGFFYFIGQLVICFAVWFGSCMIVCRTMT